MSVTALSEYADMLFTRASLELKDRWWWLEMRPGAVGNIDPKGFVMLRATVTGSPGVVHEIEYRATMHAIENNMAVNLTEMETVIEYHLTKFMKEVKAAERGEELIEQNHD